jgi:hypothetical protein
VFSVTIREKDGVVGSALVIRSRTIEGSQIRLLPGPVTCYVKTFLVSSDTVTGIIEGSYEILCHGDGMGPL